MFRALFATVIVIFCCVLVRADVPRVHFNTAQRYVRVEVLTDSLFHLEVESGPLPANLDTPLITSPYIVETNFSGPSSVITKPNSVETKTFKLLISTPDLCVTFFDKTKGVTLTKVCPFNPTGALGGLTLSQEGTKNVYGLGEQFKNPGNPNGDWLGQVRSSKLPQGNTMDAFEGGGVGNALFPIMYALGSGTVNYALFLDHLLAQTWDFSADPWKVQTQEEPLRFYLIGGANLPALRHQFMNLVGHPTVPPLKAFGLWLSQFGYSNWAEMEGKLTSLRSNFFPIDGFVLDALWSGPFNTGDKGNHIGAMTFDLQNFPDPPGHIKSFADRGLGIMLHEDPFVETYLSGYSDMAQRGGMLVTCQTCGPRVIDNYLGEIGIIDWTNEVTADYWHLSRRQPLMDMGVSFHWTDFSEMDGYGGDDWYHGVTSVGHTAMENHNIFSFKWAQSIARGYEEVSHSAVRHFILTRSGTPGIQRFGAALWSGDIGSNMKSLAAHLNAQMNLSLSGLDYYGSDCGGYQRSALEGDLNDVYTKWFAHSSAFDVPLRPHTNDWDKTQETAPDRIGDRPSNLANLRLRYELSPYYYSLAYNAFINGDPVIPPLVYYFQGDTNVRPLADEKMIGPWILVAAAPQDGPVTRDVYVPAGDWVDYRTQALIHSTGQKFTFNFQQSGLFQLPYLVRQGAIIPILWVDDSTMNILGMRTDGLQITDLNLRVYLSNLENSFTVYEDDGKSTAYLSNAVARTTVTEKFGANTGRITVSSSEGGYNGAPVSRRVVLRVILPGKTPVSVTLDGQKLPQFSTRTDFENADNGWFNDPSGLTYVRTPSLPVSDQKDFTLTY